MNSTATECSNKNLLTVCDPNKGDSDLQKVYHLHQKKKREKKFLSKAKAVYVKR